jgi:hypothetical protein
MPIYVKLRTAPGVTPYEEVDLTGHVGAIEPSPVEYDANDTNVLGEEVGQMRAIRRNIRLDGVGMTHDEVELLRRWKHDRVPVCFSPNYDGNTVFYCRFARNDPLAGVPVPMIGSNPTFARTSPSGSASATYFGADGLFHKVGNSVPRYERTAASWGELTGIKLCGQTKQYCAYSRATGTGTLLRWTAGSTATIEWATNIPSMLEDAGLGVALMKVTGTPDANSYITQSITVDNATVVSVGVWVRGEGSFYLSVNSGVSGAPVNGTTTVLTGNAWTLLKIENVTTNATTLVMRVLATGARGWCALSHWQTENNSIVTQYIDNTSGAAVTMPNDNLYFGSLVAPHFEGTITVGFEVPTLFATGIVQGLLGNVNSVGTYMELRYKSGAWWFQKAGTAEPGSQQYTSNALGVSVGSPVVLANYYSNATLRQYINGTQGASTASPTAASALTLNATGLRVGYDGTDIRNGFGGGKLLFLRVDQGPRDASGTWHEEHQVYAPSLWTNPDQRAWTRMTEGRVFKIDAPEHQLIAGTVNSARLTLKEIRSYRSATTEAY